MLYETGPFARPTVCCPDHSGAGMKAIQQQTFMSDCEIVVQQDGIEIEMNHSSETQRESATQVTMAYKCGHEGCAYTITPDMLRQAAKDLLDRRAAVDKEKPWIAGMESWKPEHADRIHIEQEDGESDQAFQKRKESAIAEGIRLRKEAADAKTESETPLKKFGRVFGG